MRQTKVWTIQSYRLCQAELWQSKNLKNNSTRRSHIQVLKHQLFPHFKYRLDKYFSLSFRYLVKKKRWLNNDGWLKINKKCTDDLFSATSKIEWESHIFREKKLPRKMYFPQIECICCFEAIWIEKIQ